jgi:hypothetical protein
VVKNIIFSIIIIVLFFFCILFGWKYYTTDRDYKKFIRTESDRISKYQSELANANGIIEQLKSNHDGDVAELGKFKEIIGRTEINNRQLTESNKNITDASIRSEIRNRQAIENLERLIDQIKLDNACNDSGGGGYNN